jgi:hypothetical protein
MKTVLLVFAYFSWILTLVMYLGVVIDIQPMFGNKVTHNDVLMFALISIASSGIWLCFNEQAKNEKAK